MKTFTDHKRSERQLDVGTWVWLKPQPYTQRTLQIGENQKLAPKYIEPFLVIAKIGQVAYKLDYHLKCRSTM